MAITSNNMTQQNKTVNSTSNNNKNSKKQQVSNSTENWLPVENIQNGQIILENKWKVTGVKITPKNIFILDPDSQLSVLVALKNLYNTLDYEFWIVSADRPVDITIYLSQLQLLYTNTQNPKVRKLIQEDIDKAEMFKENNVVDTEYYLLFQEKKDDIIQKRVRDLISGFTGSGLVAMQTTNEDLRVLLENFLNGGQSTPVGTVLPL